MPKDAIQHRSVPLVRELVRTYQAFEQLSNARVREHGLTPAQFDVIATLGNTEGMSCKLLSEKTLITKGTLTGVLDRLLEKNLIERRVGDNDRRSLFVSLSPAGEDVFNKTFPDVVAYCGSAYDDMSEQEIADSIAMLSRLRNAISTKLEP